MCHLCGALPLESAAGQLRAGQIESDVLQTRTHCRLHGPSFDRGTNEETDLPIVELFRGEQNGRNQDEELTRKTEHKKKH